MWIRTVIGVFVGALTTLGSAAPAAAQNGKVDMAIGYQYLRFIDEGGESIPKGWSGSVTVGANDTFRFVGDMGGHYKGDYKLHTFQAGFEVARQTRVAPFVRVLAGLGYATESGDASNAFVFTPEVGVKMFGSGRVGAQVAVGFPIFRAEGDTEKTMRLFVGIVVRGK